MFLRRNRLYSLQNGESPPTLLEPVSHFRISLFLTYYGASSREIKESSMLVYIETWKRKKLIFSAFYHFYSC